MGALSDYLARAGDGDPTLLMAIREVVVNADDRGIVERAQLSEHAQHSAERLRDLGLADLLPPPDPAAAEGSWQWSRLRLTPAARADLMEADIQDERAKLVQQIDDLLESHPPEVSASADAPVGQEFLQAAPGSSDSPEATRDVIVLETGSAHEDDASHLATNGGSDRGPVPPGTAVSDGNGEAPAPGENGSTLASRGLIKIYRKRRVVNEVDLYLRQGEIVGLLGPNGAGKTTTFYMVVGLIKPDRGKVFLGSEDVTDVPMYRRARRGIGYLAQEPSIFRKLSVEENVLAVLQMLGLSRREQRERLEGLLDELGIKHLRHSKAYALSGGERRRLEITRALVGNPKFMLLDEPFAGVDPIAVHDIQQIVADLRRRGIGVLISDHNVEQTLDIVDRAYIMYDGRVRVSGTVSELVWNDEVAEIYLGPTLTARMRQRYVQPD
jgi:LPS export ABC transporter ATP-binding protein